MERRLFSKKEWPLLLIIALAAALWLVLSRSGPGGTRAGDVAVCLPGRIALRLEGPKTDQTPDAETY